MFPSVRSCVFAVLLCVSYSYQRSTPEDSSYVAAVVEYEVQSNTNVNLQNYVRLIEEAAEQNADIVVFPEMTLTRGLSVVVPINGSLVDNPIPALQPDLYDEIMVNISSAARQNEVYVVINVQEIVNCTENNERENCPEPNVYLFNTNVVFDRDGAVIDRYRKINLFGEFTRTPALTPDLGVFTTDFGVTFGHFICFDLMFQVPAVQLVEMLNITDVIFTTMWFSELPYLTAIEIQQAYAYSMNVNFLASGANNVAVGSAGSGIYSGRAGTLISIMPGVPTTRLLVSRVPKVPGEVNETYAGPIYDDPSDHDSLRLISDPSLPSHVTRLLRTAGSEEFTLVDRDVVCYFRVRLSERNGTGPFYRAFVQDGVNVYAKRPVGTIGCLLVACKTEDVNSCAYRFPKEEEVGIEELEIEMTSYRKHYNSTLKCEDIVYYPISLRNNKFPLSPKNFTYKIDDNQNSDLEENNVNLRSKREHISYKINSPQKEIISFGIWGRIYNRDGKIEYNPSEEDVQKYIEIENEIYNRYRAAAFSGVRSFSGMATGGSRICSVFACAGDTIDTCGQRFPEYAAGSTGIFEELHITAIAPPPRTNAALNANNSSYFPISLDTSIMPLKSEDYVFESRSIFDIMTIYSFNLTNSAPELYSFAIWGREYTTDGEEAAPPREHDIEDVVDETTTTSSPDVDTSTPGASVIHQISLILLIASVIFTVAQELISY